MVKWNEKFMKIATLHFNLTSVNFNMCVGVLRRRVHGARQMKYIYLRQSAVVASLKAFDSSRHVFVGQSGPVTITWSFTFCKGFFLLFCLTFSRGGSERGAITMRNNNVLFTVQCLGAWSGPHL